MEGVFLPFLNVNLGEEKVLKGWERQSFPGFIAVP